MLWLMSLWPTLRVNYLSRMAQINLVAPWRWQSCVCRAGGPGRKGKIGFVQLLNPALSIYAVPRQTGYEKTSDLNEYAGSDSA